MELFVRIVFLLISIVDALLKPPLFALIMPYGPMEAQGNILRVMLVAMLVLTLLCLGVALALFGQHVSENHRKCVKDLL